MQQYIFQVLKNQCSQTLVHDYVYSLYIFHLLHLTSNAKKYNLKSWYKHLVALQTFSEQTVTEK
jgi:hypothetical protein